MTLPINRFRAKIFQGLQYLHQSFMVCHGNLTANNCLVDSHWSVKLTDFGITNLLNSWTLDGLLVERQPLSQESQFEQVLKAR
ncbi:MAG: protein kinase [Gammaproteobacteria bacterium]|nr:protein kinase [Gammaproteobacteria bacterium]